MIKIGLDLGSTTIKAVALDDAGNILFKDYRRHNAKIAETLAEIVASIETDFGNEMAAVAVTGSVGMGLAEKCGMGFVQEVVAVTKALKHNGQRPKTMIDIGGEDAKVVFFDDEGKAEDLKMNGNCSGGTGAFIDQMAVILNEDIEKLNELALRYVRIHPIAARCGVFCKTDIQNLVAKGVSKEDIAASIFHAVVIQTIVTLAHGREIKPPILLCGGPLSFIPALRNAFREYLKLQEEDVILPENPTLLPALGCAASLGADGDKVFSVKCLKNKFISALSSGIDSSNTLPRLFDSEDQIVYWRRGITSEAIRFKGLSAGYVEAYLGIDSGSTTTKVAVIDKDCNLLYKYYGPNSGKSVETVRLALEELEKQCAEVGTVLSIKGSCSTGYGEDLIKAAFGLDYGIVETMAHYIAAKKNAPNVSFILDIGGQDMKAMFIREGLINRVEINEACSSGCGSFIETFAKSTNCSVEEFSKMACRSQNPCDLGTRCTVFMNSKVKQVLREGYKIEDISAGLAYSVVRNCLHKVLKISDLSELGNNIVVQGGTMKNDAVVRALELSVKGKITRCAFPELMGAIGCAIYSFEAVQKDANSQVGDRMLSRFLMNCDHTTRTVNCKGCSNRCEVTAMKFADGKVYYSGNRCEKVFANAGDKGKIGANIWGYKYAKVFERGKEQSKKRPKARIGIPRVLNMYEDFPFWATLLEAAGFEVVLSGESSYGDFEKSAGLVMSDNICFPAKLVHSHINNLVAKGVDRILYPFVIHSRENGGQNSYNCPIVTAYPEVIRNVHDLEIPFDCDTFSMKDERLFRKQCIRYITGLGVTKTIANKAFNMASAAYFKYVHDIASKAKEICSDALNAGRTVILLAGRPYHADPLIQHKVPEMISALGIDVISDDIVRDDLETARKLDGVNFLAQWSYTNRILQAALWCAEQGEIVQFVQMTSFGCGPDAFLTDAVRDILKKSGKTLTLLKLDDISNVGSMRLRVRSLVESLSQGNSSKLSAVRGRWSEVGGQKLGISNKLSAVGSQLSVVRRRKLRRGEGGAKSLFLSSLHSFLRLFPAS